MVDQDRVVELIQEFMEEHQVVSEDVIFHSPSIVEATPEFLSALFEVVGFVEPDIIDDDDDDLFDE